MPTNMKYISDFLITVEGECVNRGYIPCDKVGGGTANYTGGGDPNLFKAMGVSGVTIGVGCDLGQTTAQTMLSYGLEQDIVNRLIPYFGLKRNDAIQKLHTLPLTVSMPVAHEITYAVHNGYLRYVLAAYPGFSDLPKQAQAVIFSMCYQKGCGGVKRDWPKVWGMLLAKDWCGASKELMTGFKQYAARRATEGKLLKELC